jgi:hypothetical protein
MKLRHTKLSTFVFALLLGLLSPSIFVTAAGKKASPAPQKRSQNRRVQETPAAKTPRVDYSQFSHRTHVDKQKLTCDSCHKVPSKNWKEVRKGDAAFPDVTDFPEHSSCLDCHRTQFFARERPAPVICSNCHVKSSPRDTSRYLFPSLGDITETDKKRRVFVSEFAVGFPHEQHLDVVGLNAPAQFGPAVQFVIVSFQEKKEAMPKSCPVCHQTYQPQGNSSEEYVTKPAKNIGDNFWLKKGSFKTIPDSHTVCFTCHNSDSGIAPEPKDCNVCHKLVTRDPSVKFDFDPKLVAGMGITDDLMIARWSRRSSAGAFRHEGGEHPDVSCVSCHNVATLNTIDLKTLKVPVRSCGGAEGCHITPTTDDGGALNFEVDQKEKDPAFVCTKCHIEFGRAAIPPGNAKAIPTPAVKKPS